jgi:hypothetical protein
MSINIQTNHLFNQKFISLKCKKCKIELSKNFLNEKHLISVTENEIWKINPIYLKCFTPYGESHISVNNKYLYDNVKCISCNKRFGRYVKAAIPDMGDLIEYIFFLKKNIIM